MRLPVEPGTDALLNEVEDVPVLGTERLMDMHKPFIAAVRRWVPEAGWKIAFDRFHVAAHLIYKALTPPQ